MPTLSEIARRAGVSVGTVDRVIHNRGRVSDETRERVQAIVDELHYKPNVIARNLSLKKNYRLGTLMPIPHQDGRYWELPESGIRKAIEEIKMYKVEMSFFFYDKYSHDSFQEAADAILAEDDAIDGLVIAPVLSRDAERFVGHLRDTIPYVFIDSYLPNTKSLSYIGQESFQSGVLAAKLMSLQIREGDVASCRVLPEDYHLEDRVRGFCSAIQTIPGFRLHLYEANREQDSQIFFKVTEQMIRDHPDLKGIFIPSACAHQAAECLSRFSMGDRITLIGYDLVEENRDYMKRGVIDFIISQRPAFQGYQAVYSLYRHLLLKEPVESKMTVPMDILTRENVDYYQG